MSISLKKGESINLKKDTPQLNKISMGLGWDMVKPKSGGGMFSMFKSAPESIDLDASCILLDERNEMVDAVWFRALKSKCNSVKHAGDNLTGEGDGDDEKIEITLDAIPSNVQKLVFVVSSFRGQSFDSISNAFCRIVDTSTNKELVKIDLSCQGKHTGQIMAVLVKNAGAWSFKAIGENTNATVFEQMMPLIKKVVADL